MNRGVSVRYGKNLIDIKQEQNCSSVATGVYPYWVSIDSSALVELPEKIIDAPGTYNFVKIHTLDLSTEFETQPTEEQLRTRAERYVKENNIGVPTVSLTVSFVQLDQTEEYKHLNLLERVSLFDIVNVEFPALNVSATAKAVKMVYDVLADRVKSVTLGSVCANIADTVAKQSLQIVETAKTEAKRAINGQTSEDIFNTLTDHGRIQGIYIEDGQWYINAEIVKVINLIADKLYSKKDNSELFVSGSSLSLSTHGQESARLENWEDGIAYLYFTEYDQNGTDVGRGQFGARRVQLGGTWANPDFAIWVDKDGNTDLKIDGSYKTISWKNNGDGTYNLIGR
jgi:hypothetical protein